MWYVAVQDSTSFQHRTYPHTHHAICTWGRRHIYIYIYWQLYRKDGGRSRTAPGATNFHQIISRSSYGLLLWDRAVATCQLAGHDLGGCAREAGWKEGGWVSKHNASKNPFFFFLIYYMIMQAAFIPSQR